MRGGGVSGVTYPGPPGIIGAPGYNRGPGGPKFFVLWLKSGMQFKCTYLYYGCIKTHIWPISRGPPPPPSLVFSGLMGPQMIRYPGLHYDSHRPWVHASTTHRKTIELTAGWVHIAREGQKPFSDRVFYRSFNTIERTESSSY